MEVQKLGVMILAHYLSENNCSSYMVTSGGELLKYIDKKKVKLIRLPVHSKNPILIFFNSIILVFIILFYQYFNCSCEKSCTSMVLFVSNKNYKKKVCYNFSWNL